MASTKENEAPNTPSTAATTEATATANDSPALSSIGGSGIETPANCQDVPMKDARGSLTGAVVDEEDAGRRKRRSTSRTPASTNSDAPATKKPKTGSTKKSKASTKRDQELLDMAWICVACREAECAMDPESELLVCEGPCRRLFHISCAGLPGLPPDDVTWHCHDCQHKKHLCGFCQEYGQDQEDVFKCQKTECGLFFHEACLEMQNIPVETRVINGEKTEVIAGTGGTPSSPNGAGNTAEAPKELHFTCPAHWCWTCTQEDMVMDNAASATAAETGKNKGKTKGKRKKKSTHTVFIPKKAQRLFPCLDCPISYHLTCIPPSAKFHELALLCHEHADTKELPALNMESSMQGNVEAAADQKLQKMQNHDNLLAKRSLARNSVYKSRGSVSRNPFFPAGVTADRRTNKEQLVLSKISESTTDVVTTKDNTSNGESGGGDENKCVDVNSATHMVVGDGNKCDRLLFCLPADVQEEVHAKPPPYKHIHSLKYYPENRPKKIPTPQDICTCVSACDDDCINRLLYVECFGSNGTAGDDNSSSRKGTNCRLGPNCGNRRLGQRQHVKKCKPATEKGKGWGLVTMENVKKDSLVQEYLGDVIDEKEKERRLKEWSIEHPNDPNFYIMCLSQGWYIDARETANMSRFINHSCDPNCVLQRLNVGGYMRDGIFALRDIKAGEFLSYDYHFDTKLGDKFICRCGSANCRGTMMLKNMKKDAAKKTKSELWNDAKQQLEKDKEFLKEFEARERRNATVQEVLPGSASKKQEWVANGVQDKDRTYVIRSRLFLWRNAVLGSDFSSRWRRYSVTEGVSGSSSKLLARRKSSKEKKSRALSASKPIDVISVVQANQTHA